MQTSSLTTRFLAPLEWQADLFKTGGIFADLTHQFPLADLADFPDCELLTLWLHQRTELQDWRFVDSNALEQDGRYYEEFIFQTRQIPVRQRNWHDLFGALIWCLFPVSKVLMNQLHMQQIAEFGMKERSKIRHKLTLLDECGVLIGYTQEQKNLIELLREQRWTEAFYHCRDDWSGIRVFVFGHANYEMATRPFIGLTAKLWCFELSAEQAADIDIKGCQNVDKILAKQLVQPRLLLDNQQLSPLPLLGVPGWHQQVQDLEFYADTSYFRPKRIKMNAKE